MHTHESSTTNLENPPSKPLPSPAQVAEYLDISIAEVMRNVRIAEAVKQKNRSRTSLWRDVKAGKLPAPRETGPNSKCWTLYELIRDDVAALMDQSS